MIYEPSVMIQIYIPTKQDGQKIFEPGGAVAPNLHNYVIVLKKKIDANFNISAFLVACTH